MAAAKLTGLSAITTVSADDLIYAVDDPGGTPASKKVTFDNLQKSITVVGGASGVRVQGDFYLSGSESVDGSWRFHVADGVCALQIRVSGSWFSSVEWTTP